MKSSSLILIAALACIVVNSSIIPGLKVAVAPSLITDFFNYQLPSVLERFEATPLPNITKGSIHISNITLKRIYFPTSHMNFSFSENHVTLLTYKFGFSADFSYKYKLFGFIPMNDSFGAETNHSLLHIDISFGFEDNTLKLKVNKLAVAVRGLKLHNIDYFPEGIFTIMTSGIIESIMSTALSSVVRVPLEKKINSEIAKLPGFSLIPKFPIAVSYQPVKAPTIKREYLAVYLNGTFYSTTKDAQPRLHQRVDYPEFNKTSGNNIQIFISEHLLNSAGYSVWKTGIMNITINNSMIPAEARMKMNIGMLKQFVPEVSALYKNDRIELMVNVKADSAPLIILNENDIHIEVKTILTFYAILGDDLEEVVSLGSSLDIHAIASVSNWTIKPTISSVSFGPFSIIDTQAGSFDAFMMQSGLNLVLSLALPAANLIKPLIPLPDVPIVNLSSLTFAVHDGYLQIEAYPLYKTIHKQNKKG